MKKIRENAYGNFHGHTVGGTNPSLLEALASTDLNLLIDVGFNREVGQDAALYWSSDDGALAKLIDLADKLDYETYFDFGIKAKECIRQRYSWNYIGDRYKSIFVNIR